MQLDTLRAQFRPYQDDMIAFAQRLLQTPSYSGAEGAAASLVQAEMTRLRYDEVWIDRAGNAVGLIRGQSSAKSMMLNAHLDHVSVGNEDDWPFPPFSGTISNGELWGRGAVDLKGSIASMVYAVGAMRGEGMIPPWDVYVAAVVYEEEGGLGTQSVLEQVHPEFCVIGEATGNQLALGHRGAASVIVEFRGRAIHASLANSAVNAHYAAARFMLALRDLRHDTDAVLGPSSATPTLYTTDQTSGNVIPGVVRVFVDWRCVPSQTPQDVAALVQRLVDASLEPGVTGRVLPREFFCKTYTGLEQVVQLAGLAVKTDPASDLALRSRRALDLALGRSVKQMVWRFCTDGSLCVQVGVPIVGFGPGDPDLAHTVDERVALSDLIEAMAGDAALALSPALPLTTS